VTQAQGQALAVTL